MRQTHTISKPNVRLRALGTIGAKENMHVCTLLLYEDELWAKEFSSNEFAVGLQVGCLEGLYETRKRAPLICVRVSERSVLNVYILVLEAIKALQTTCETVSRTPGRVVATPQFLLLSDVPHVATVAESIVNAVQSKGQWSWLHLDVAIHTEEEAGRILEVGLKLLAESLVHPAGRKYSLSRALVDLKTEACLPSHTVKLLSLGTAFQERSSVGTPGDEHNFEYAVNGDNWHAPGEHGLYPQEALKNRVEGILGKMDSIDRSHILAVGGGIAAAFELVCNAFGLWGGHALIVGAAYGGIEHILMLRRIAMQPIFLNRPADDIVNSMSCQHDTQMIIITHPTLYAAHDISTLVGRIISKTRRSCLVVLDECYIDYITSPDHLRSDSFISGGELHELDNFVIGLRGLSKLHGLAALRLAYTVSSQAIRQRLSLATTFKSISTPVLLAAEQNLKSFDRKQALLRECRHKRSIIKNLSKHTHIQTLGHGPM